MIEGGYTVNDVANRLKVTKDSLHACIKRYGLTLLFTKLKERNRPNLTNSVKSFSVSQKNVTC
jgi:hypothetical protein